MEVTAQKNLPSKRASLLCVRLVAAVVVPPSRVSVPRACDDYWRNRTLPFRWGLILKNAIGHGSAAWSCHFLAKPFTVMTTVRRTERILERLVWSCLFPAA